MLNLGHKTKPQEDFIRLAVVTCSACGKGQATYWIDSDVFKYNKRLGAPHVAAVGCPQCQAVFCSKCLRGTATEGWRLDVDIHEDDEKTGRIVWEPNDARPNLCADGPDTIGNVYLKPYSVDCTELTNRAPRLMEVLWFMITPVLAALALGTVILFLGWIGLNSPPVSFSSGRVLEDLADELFSGPLAIYLVAIALVVTLIIVAVRRMRTSHPPFCTCLVCTDVVDEHDLCQFLESTRNETEALHTGTAPSRCFVCDTGFMATHVTQQEKKEMSHERWVTSKLLRPIGFSCSACGTDYCADCWATVRKGKCKKCDGSLKGCRVLLRPASVPTNWEPNL